MPNQQGPCIEQQAIEWFVLVRSEEDLAQRVAEFEVWFHADVAHSRAYREVEELWALCGQFAERPEMAAARRRYREGGNCADG